MGKKTVLHLPIDYKVVMKAQCVILIIILIIVIIIIILITFPVFKARALTYEAGAPSC